MTLKLLSVLILSCIALTAMAQTQPTNMSLRTLTQEPTASADMTVELLIFNTDEQPLTYEAPRELSGILQGEKRNWVINLRAMQPVATQTIAPGQFMRVPYVTTLPVDVSGRVSLETSEVAMQRLVFEIHAPAATEKNNATGLIASIKQQEADAPPALAYIERSFANRFAFHEPIYFLYGTEAPAAKFQFSFKYRLIGENSKFGDLIPPFRGFYFAYTQRSLWDINADSSPFFDTSYMPEMFFEWLAPDDKKKDGLFHWLGVQTGVRHESNGKDGDDSRSLNIAYLRTGMVLGSLNGWKMLLVPRAFFYLGKSNDNDDIARYRGHGELQLALTRNDAFQLSVSSRIGTRADRGSVQVDLTQPIRIPLINLETYLQLQYFDGYGESLRTYNQKSTVWRLGLGFVR